MVNYYIIIYKGKWQWRKNKESQSSLDSKEIKPVNPKGNPSWIFIGRTSVEAEAEVAEETEEAEDPILWPPDVKSQLIGKEPTHWKRPWCWKSLKAGGEGDDRGWDGWMASLTQWTWVWASSGRQWKTGKPWVLQSMGLQSQTTTERLTNKGDGAWKKCHFRYRFSGKQIWNQYCLNFKTTDLETKRFNPNLTIH